MIKNKIIIDNNKFKEGDKVVFVKEGTLGEEEFEWYKLDNLVVGNEYTISAVEWWKNNNTVVEDDYIVFVDDLLPDQLLRVFTRAGHLAR